VEVTVGVAWLQAASTTPTSTNIEITLRYKAFLYI
jgi:hypothetical protein